MVEKNCQSPPTEVGFQYSLCRVVLMVVPTRIGATSPFVFQYSLCRVVLMVANGRHRNEIFLEVSVLALSSRFDGLAIHSPPYAIQTVSVLALSSRFDGRIVTRW